MDNEQQSNQNPDAQSGDAKSWTPGENQFTHMSDEEKKRHLGWNPGSDELEARERKSGEHTENESESQNS